MTVRILEDKKSIYEARRELKKKKVSVVEPVFVSLLRRLKLIRTIAIGDMVKSWDVLSTIDFLEKYVKKDDPVLDIGCYASEAIVILHRLGYKDLTGVDLNPNLLKMPYQSGIRYRIRNFMHTDFKDSSFQAVTAISVIEHGFDGHSLLREISRLLKPGGYFIFSLDYWPEKIDTTDTQLFGMDWKIFSHEELNDFISQSAAYGLFPFGEMTSDFPRLSVIEHAGRHFTFAWVVLKKSSDGRG